MASQISHIVYAQKYFDLIENGEDSFGFLDEGKVFHARKINRDEFMLGVVFPDIRLLEPRIKRKDTHLKFAPLDLDFSGLGWFEAGWKFHLYCDMRREEFLNQSGFYRLKKTGEFYGRPAKLLEDKLVYAEYVNWEKLAAYFRNPPEIKNDVGADQETIVLWYAILAKYIEEKTTSKMISVFLSKLPKLAREADDLVQLVDELEQEKEVRKKLEMIQDEIFTKNSGLN